MYYSLNSEHSWSQSQNDDSESEARIYQNQNLVDQINQLTHENTVLKAQFEQAVASTKQLNEMIQKCSQLSQQNRAYKNENEHLQNRLDITIRTNKELQRNLETEKNSVSHQISQISSQKDHEIATIQKQCNSKIDTMNIQLQQMEDAKDSLETKNLALTSKIQKLLETASHYFGLTFDNIDSLTTYIQTPPSYDTNIQDNQADQDKQVDHKNCKKKIKALKKRCEKLTSEVSKLQTDLTNAQSKHANEIQSYENQIKHIKNADGKKRSKQEVKQLEAQNKNLKNELEKLRKDFQMQQQQQNAQYLQLSLSSKQGNDESDQEHSFQLNLSSMQHQQQTADQGNYSSRDADNLTQENRDLSRRLKDLERAKNDLTSKLREATLQKSDLQMKIDRLENEKTAANVVHNETLNELKGLRDIIRQKNPKIKKNEKLIEKLQDKISQMESTIRNQEDKIHTQECNLQNTKSENETISTNLKAAQSEIRSLQEKIDSLNDEILDANEKLQEKPDLTPEDIFPSSSFRYKGFDPVLSEKIETVILGQFSPTVKLNKVYSIILNHFNGIIQERERSVEHMSEHLKSVKNKLNKFIVDLSLAVSMDPITFDELVDRERSNDIVNAVSNYCRGFEDLKRKNSELNAIVDRFVDEFGQNTDLPAFISSLRHKYEEQACQLKKQIKKNKDLIKCSRLYKKNVDAQTSTFQQEKNQMATRINELSSRNEELNRKVQSLKLELESVRSEYEATRSLADHLEDTHTDFSEASSEPQLTPEMQMKLNKEKEKLKSQIKKLREENKKNANIIAEQDSTINRLKMTVSQHKDEIKEVESECSSLKQKEQDLLQKYDIEKRELTKTYENTIAEMQKQCGNHRKDAEKLTSDLIDTQEKVKQAHITISKLKKEKKRLEDDKKLTEERFNREMQLVELNAQNKITNIETNCAQEIEDVKSKLDSDKRKLFSFAAEEFRRFCCPADNLDERGYRSLIKRVRKELDRLFQTEAMVRRISGAVPKQPTDEAVSNLIY